MIKKVYSDSNTFREVEFSEGFNIILAERVEGSDERDSRNGLGKTTLFDIIKFCFGGSKKNTLKCDEVREWTFFLDISIKGSDYTVGRNTAHPGTIKLKGDFADWPIKPDADENSDFFQLKKNQWKEVLGNIIFGLPIEAQEENYTPSSGSLLSYFIRSGNRSFQDTPFEHNPHQRVWDQEVNSAFLLGLNWKYAREFQKLRDKENTLKQIKEASDEDLLEGYLGSSSELKSEKIRVEDEVQKLEDKLENFKVHEEYEEIQEEADQLTKQIHKLANKNTSAKQLLRRYKDSLQRERDVSIEKIMKTYKKTGMAFPEKVSKELEDVKKFHSEVVQNRKEYLQSEIERITEEIERRKDKIKELSEEKSNLMNILEEHGALDEYKNLQERLTNKKEELNKIQDTLENLRRLEDEKSQIKIKKEELAKKARKDLEEREKVFGSAVKLFNKNSKNLYFKPGTLSVDFGKYGYDFSVDIEREGSQGVNRMKTFSYDLMLAQLIQEDEERPDFLIHDSPIFDGVDERQLARAMELARKESENKNFQYICAINSDLVPYDELSDEFKKKFDKEFVRLELTDATEDGGLLGIRF